MTYYVGILDGEHDAWGVRIPDCPGAFGAGTTPESAIQNAISGLTVWAEAPLKDGDPLPAACSIIAIRASDDSPDASEMAVMIPLLLDAGRTVRANLTFDSGLLAAIDDEAIRRGVTRSAFLASAPREKIGSA